MSDGVLFDQGRQAYALWLGVPMLALTLLACKGNDPAPPGVGTPNAPLISALTPPDGTTAAALNVQPSAVFTMGMTPLTGTTFTLVAGTTPVAGSVTNSADGKTATFSPNLPLTPGTTFTAAITGGAMSAGGINLALGHAWSFTTTQAVTLPVVHAVAPAANAAGVALNAPVTVTFNEGMDPLTLTASSFTLQQGGSAVPAGLTFGTGNTVTLTPASPLAPGALCTATLSTQVKDLQGNPLAATYVWTFTTVAATPTLPVVTSTQPAASATGVAVGMPVSATFSEPISALTLTPATFTLAAGPNPVTGTVAYATPTSTATFTPGMALAAATVYTATLTPGVQDPAGNALAKAFTWTFTTAAAVDTVAPTVLSTAPAANATGVLLTAPVTATLSKAINPLTVTSSSFTLVQGTTPVAGALTFGANNTTATFTPTQPLVANTTYTAALTPAVQGANGIGLAGTVTWSFTTLILDTTPPMVSSTNPVAAATNVALNATVDASFSKAIDPATLTGASFTLKQGTTAVTGAIAYGPGASATFTPALPLSANTTYTATLSTAVKDASGLAMANPFAWTFTTGSTAKLGPAVVNLGTAGNFAILAETGISTVPGSMITGDLGLSPAAASYLTGFTLSADPTNVFSTSTQVVGKAYAADYAVPTPTNLTPAVGDMDLAYTDAAGRPTPDFLNLDSGNLGGLTLAPGLYHWTSSITMPSNVTISGGPNDVWIFQTSGDLSMSSAVLITLAGGAQAKNIFWQVAGQVDLGTGAHLEGILLCQTQVTLRTSSTMNGRILAQTMVALQQATVTVPAP